MTNRCFNPNTPNYHQYGGRGITMQDSWRDFKCFLADMGIRPHGTSIDRRDTDGDYTVANCRWATASEQQSNRRPYTQPAGRVYGNGICQDCTAPFTKKSPLAGRCPACLAYSRRYHKNG